MDFTRASRAVVSPSLSSTTAEPFDTDRMASEFLQQYADQAFSVGQHVRVHTSTRSVTAVGELVSVSYSCRLYV